MLNTPVPTASRPLSWVGRSGAWLAIGTSPGAFVLGAQLANRHGGAIPVAGLLIGAAAMGALLYLQGRLGLTRAPGVGLSFVAMTRGYLGTGSRRVLGIAIAVSVTGWVAFATGIGAESTTRLTGASQMSGSLCLGGIVLALALIGINRWNGVAAITTVTTLVLAVLVIAVLDDRQAPVSLTVPAPHHALVDISVLIGYIAVFSVRAPDFTQGMTRRLDVVASIALLILPALALCLVGAELYLVAGAQDGEALASMASVQVMGVGVGDMLLVIAIVAPAVTSTYSGGLALQIFTGSSLRTGILAVTGLSVTAAALNFQDHLIPYLMLVAAALPPAALPFSVEAWARRRGATPRLIPWWTWAPGSALGGVVFIVGGAVAPLAALTVAVGCTLTYATLRHRELPAASR